MHSFKFETIRSEIRASTSCGKCAQSALIPLTLAFTLKLKREAAFENNDGLALNLQLALFQFHLHETGSL